MHRIFYLLLLAGYLMAACRTGKKDGAAPDRALSFGSGGGFTGAVTTFTLRPDGTLHRTKTYSPQSEQIGTVDRQKTARLFKEAETLLSRNASFSHPGNQYFFVKLETDEAQIEATWGSADHPPPAGLVTLYEELINTTKP